MKRNVLFASIMLSCAMAFAQSRFTVTTDHPDALYRCGEETVFTVTALDKDNQPVMEGTVTAILDNFGPKRFTTRKINLAEGNPFQMKGTLTEPGFLRLRVNGDHFKEVVWGTGYEPLRIVQGEPCPADFDAFWANAMKRAEETVPLDPHMAPVPERSTDAFTFYRVSFATLNDRRIYGYMTVPKDSAKAPYPVQVTVPGAGCGNWANQVSGSPDRIILFLTVMTFEPDYDQNKVQPLFKEMVKSLETRYQAVGYPSSGIAESRESYFYYPVILGINRAVNWVAARPDVDLKRFTYTGTSQGGGFGLILCGLNKHFTKGAIFVPAITDLLGDRAGRQPGWPQIIRNQAEQNRAAAGKNAPYFDGANFAARITIPVRVVVGFADMTCAPCAVYAGYTAIPSNDKQIVHGIGMGHSVRGEFYQQLGAWLSAD